jgi:hypothetical protein
VTTEQMDAVDAARDAREQQPEAQETVQAVVISDDLAHALMVSATQSVLLDGWPYRDHLPEELLHHLESLGFPPDRTIRPGFQAYRSGGQWLLRAFVREQIGLPAGEWRAVLLAPGVDLPPGFVAPGTEQGTKMAQDLLMEVMDAVAEYNAAPGPITAGQKWEPEDVTPENVVEQVRHRLRDLVNVETTLALALEHEVTNHG